MLSYSVEVRADCYLDSKNDKFEWIRKDYNVKIFKMDKETEEEKNIGFMELVLFNLIEFNEQNEDCIIECFDDEQETMDLYRELKNNSFPLMLTNEFSYDRFNLLKNAREGVLLYLENIWIYEEFRGKGYGSFTLKNLNKIVEFLFNINVSGIISLLAPMYKTIVDGETQFYYKENNEDLNTLKCIFNRCDFKFIESGNGNYCYRIHNYFGKD